MLIFALMKELIHSLLHNQFCDGRSHKKKKRKGVFQQNPFLSDDSFKAGLQPVLLILSLPLSPSPFRPPCPCFPSLLAILRRFQITHQLARLVIFTFDSNHSNATYSFHHGRRETGMRRGTMNPTQSNNLGFHILSSQGLRPFIKTRLHESVGVKSSHFAVGWRI